MKYEIIKGNEKDFEGAPEWVTKLIVGERSVHKSYVGTINGIVFISGVKEPFNAAEMNLSYLHSVIAERRPTTEPVVNQQLTTEWDATTPPPVGMECEVLFTSEGSIFERARILHVGDDGVVGRWLTGDSAGGLFDYAYVPHDYRNIRSLEDVARDEAAKGLVDFLDRETDRNNVFHKHELIGFYDYIAAGKIPSVTKTPTVSELMRVTENATREDCEAIVKMLSGK